MDIRYIAGIFDGEGCVRVQRWQKPNSPHIRYQVICLLGMVDPAIPTALHKQFGGSLLKHDSTKYNKNARPTYRWLISSQAAKAFLTKVRPHLVVKREEAEIALVLQKNIDRYNHKLSHRNGFHPKRDEILQYRESLHQKLKALKKKSF